MVKFIFGGGALMGALWMATFHPATFGLIVLGIAVFIAANEWRNE